MARPFVSVLLDTYNHEKFIEQAVSSVLEQDFPAAEREIIVVDDGSTDRTPALLAKFAPEVRVLRKSNGGQGSAFNAGIPECRGEIIAFLDGDDWWAPGKLRRVTDVMAADPAIGLVGHGIKNSFADGSEQIAAPEKAERLRLDSLAAARVFRLRKAYLGTSRMTMRAALARQILPVPAELVIEADEYLFTLAAALSDIVILREPLTHYRIHGENLFLAAGGSQAGMRRMQGVMAALAASLQEKLPGAGVPGDAVICIAEIIRAEADQLRLALDGGTPWETFQTERSVYGMHHADAPWTHRIFRGITMIPALLLPPRWFYGVRRWLASRSWYRRAREQALPAPGITHVAGAKEFKA